VMRYLQITAAAVAALVAVVLIVGWLLPVRHRATRSIRVGAPPQAVFALVSNVGAYPRWRTGVTEVELLPSDASTPRQRFRERGGDGAILYEIVERLPDHRLVTRIADPDLPFGGRWTYELSAVPGGTMLRITEDGEVYNPVFRFVSRFVMGHTRTLDRYLRDVATRLGGLGEVGD